MDVYASDIEGMTNTEILVIGIQFSSLFFTSRFCLQFTNSNSPPLHRDKIYLPIRFIVDQGFVIVSLQFTISI